MKVFKFGYSLQKLPEVKSSMALTGKELEVLLLKKLEGGNSACKETMWNLARLYSRSNRLKDALEFMSKLLSLSENDEERASCLLAMGGIMEKMDDYEHAAVCYREGFLLNPADKRTWYFINNNLGYCLNQLQRFAEAREYFLTAIKTDPTRSNAYKNLGLCFQGLGEYIKAAKCFIAAIKADAADARPLNHLKDLLKDHPELNGNIADLEEKVTFCDSVTDLARKMQPDFASWWEECRRQFN